MKRAGIGILMVCGALSLAACAFSQGEKQGQGTAIVTILPKHEGGAAPTVTAQGVNLKVNGKETQVTNLVPMQGANGGLELVILIDGSARSSLGRQLDDLAEFVKSLPPNTKAAFAYMQNGRAAFAGQLSADHAVVLQGLHLPAGTPGSNASPYFCLSDLAKHWPSGDTAARREVVMITDGFDEYNARFDPEDPYMQTAVSDSVKAGLVVYSIYWQGQGFGGGAFGRGGGQNLLLMVSEATGGKSFWEGTGNPVSFQPYLEELSRRFKNQYEVSFLAPFNGKPQVEPMKLKFSAPGSEVSAPQQVFVVRPGVAEN